LLGGAWAQPGGSTAAAAAAGGEGGEPVSKRVRKGPVKRVVWKADHDLVAVRWFIKDDPPAQVRAGLRCSYCLCFYCHEQPAIAGILTG
jgi:hypothetical protein